jgi:hypothetical protein
VSVQTNAGQSDSATSSFTVTPSYTVTFYTDPSSATVTVDGSSKTDGTAGTYLSGARVHVIANLPSGYSFLNWETSGVTVDSASSQDTYVTVSGNGWLKAHFMAIPLPGPTLGPALRMSTNTYASQFPVLAASDSYVYLAWSDNAPVAKNGGQPEVWLRVSSNSGASFGTPIRMSTNTGASVSPSVAASGNYVYVAWSDNTPVSGSGSDYEVWMCVSSNSGARFGSAIRISANTGWSGQPSVAASGNYVYVVWSDSTPVTGSGGLREVWMRVSSNNGASFGSAIRISKNTGVSVYPSVAAAGSFVYVAWSDNTPVSGSGSASEIWMRVSSNNGGSLGPAIRMSTNTYDSVSPSLAAAGSYVYVAWQDSTPVTGSGSNPEIWVRVSNNLGASFASAIRISTNTGQSAYPSVAVIGGYVYLTWEDDTPVSGSGSSYEIWLRASSNSGASFGSAIRMSTNTGASVSPSVAASGSYVYVAWSDNTPVSGSGTQPEIWNRVGK